MKSFDGLWPCLKMGGIYVIEDLHYNYWEVRAPFRGGGLDNPQSAMEKFKRLADTLNRRSVAGEDLMQGFPGDEFICEISFGMNILAVQKCTERHMKRKSHWAKERGYDKRLNKVKMSKVFEEMKKLWP